MKKLQTYFNKLGSRKFQVLLIAIGLFIFSPSDFTGSNMVTVMCVYMGVNTLQKFTGAGE